MMQWLKMLVSKPPEPLLAPTSNDNVILITAYLNRGVVVISHKGQVHKALFEDNTLRKMITGADQKRRQTAIESFISAIAQIIVRL